MPVVAILGRPNVGKSTLFNRLARQRRAVVDETAGVTRDRNYANIEWSGKQFVIVDTGGLVIDAKEGIELAITAQAEIAAKEADIVLFVIERKIMPEDMSIAKKLRKGGFNVIPVVNKVDKEQFLLELGEVWSLGLGEPIPISALNGRGVGDFLDKLVKRLPETGKGEGIHSEIRVAIIGKPNVGKSSYVNRLLGEEKLVVNDIPGTTRDAIDTPFLYNGKRWLLTDTAGILRKQHGLDYYSSLRTIATIKRSDIVMLLTDATEGFGAQDKRIAGMAIDFYKGLVIGINKWDIVEVDEHTAIEREREIHYNARFLNFVPIITLSALTGMRVRKSLAMLEMVAEERSRRISTSEVNKVIEAAVGKRPPPIIDGKRPNILFATQERSNPPVFVFFCRGARYVATNYKRYLSNRLREEFSFKGVPLKLVFRERKSGVR